MIVPVYEINSLIDERDILQGVWAGKIEAGRKAAVLGCNVHRCESFRRVGLTTPLSYYAMTCLSKQIAD